MRLRSKLLLAVVFWAVPIVGLATWALIVREQTAEVARIEEYVLARMNDGGRAACEADPASFPRTHEVARGPGPPAGSRRAAASDPGGPGRPGSPDDDRRARTGPPPPPDGPRDGPPPGPEPRDGRPPRVGIFAYDASFESANPRAPPFPVDLRAELEQGAERAHSSFARAGRRGLHVALRMPWSDGPCAIVLATRFGDPPPWMEERHWLTAGALTLGLLVAVLLAAGPIIARVRRLTEDVQRSTEARYATEVTADGHDELASLAHAFNEAGAQIHAHIEAIEQRERALRDFVENTTHDLMIPLTVLQGHLATLSRGGASPTVRDAMEEVQYTTALVENLGAAAKLESGARALQRGPVELGALLARVAARHVPIARAKGVELAHAAPEDELVVDADLTLLEQAIGNLVHNAVRFAEPGGHVALTAELDGETGFVVRVLDDGPGIPSELLARLTERSFRSDEARTRHPEGRGLGLHIASEVARLHGMRLTLAHRPGGGIEASLAGPRLATR